jgi:hypothetical protein
MITRIGKEHPVRDQGVEIAKCSKASMTLDVYAGLFGDDLDAVAERMDAGFSEADGSRPAAVAHE